MNGELSGMTSQIPSISPTAQMPMSGSDHELWKLTILERIGRFRSNFHSFFFWFFLIRWRKENPSNGFLYNVLTSINLGKEISPMSMMSTYMQNFDTLREYETAKRYKLMLMFGTKKTMELIIISIKSQACARNSHSAIMNYDIFRYSSGTAMFFG